MACRWDWYVKSTYVEIHTCWNSSKFSKSIHLGIIIHSKVVKTYMKFKPNYK